MAEKFKYLVTILTNKNSIQEGIKSRLKSAPSKPYSDLNKSIERRPRTRWADVVQRDALQLLGTRRRRRRAANRDEWRHLMREAKAWKGL
jgi:hypothetical protein